MGQSFAPCTSNRSGLCSYLLYSGQEVVSKPPDFLLALDQRERPPEPTQGLGIVRILVVLILGILLILVGFSLALATVAKVVLMADHFQDGRVFPCFGFEVFFIVLQHSLGKIFATGITPAGANLALKPEVKKKC